MNPPRRARVVLAVTAAIIVASIALDRHRVWRLVIGDGGQSKMPAIRSAGNTILGFFDRALESTEGRAEFRERVLRVQAQRQQRLVTGCKALVAQSSSGARSKSGTRLSLVVNIPSPLRLTYCAIPKCGTTTWFHFFEVVTSSKCKSAEVHSCARVKFNRPSSIDDFLPRSLVIVRDPWRRLISAYEDKFVTQRHRLAASCYRRHDMSLHNSKPVTFAEFVKCLLEDYRNGRSLNAHYAPQHWQCSLCRANYTYIAKMETLADDFQYLITFVFSHEDSQDYQNIFTTGRRRPTEVHNVTSIVYDDCYRSLEPPDMAALVSLYRPDAELFGYPLHPLPSFRLASAWSVKSP